MDVNDAPVEAVITVRSTPLKVAALIIPDVPVSILKFDIFTPSIVTPFCSVLLLIVSTVNSPNKSIFPVSP